jgi:mannose-6-phosphate isomerase
VTALPLYPLRFEPIYEYRPWGGRRLADLIAEPLPAHGTVGEAWVLSDRDDHPSRVCNGPLTGRSLQQLLRQFPEQMMGDLTARFDRFPLLLKFLDVQTALSVQVHPSQQDTAYIPVGETAKTEAWFVLRTGENSRVYAGLKPDATLATVRQAIAVGELPDQLASFTPQLGDTVFIPAGTVHALSDVVVFEVQQNSDVTYRLYDWDNADANTGQPRALQIDQALACINFQQGPVHPVTPLVEPGARRSRKRLLSSRHFCLRQIGGDSPCAVGVAGRPQVLICTEGTGRLDHQGASYDIRAGQVWLLPAQVGAAMFRPAANATLLEVEIPDGASADDSTANR